MIDAVITWVDGQDPRHMAKRNQIIPVNNAHAQTKASAALTSVNEIAYCVESIIRYAPFIRTIFIVTDDQVPEISLTYPTRVKVVDHRDIFKGHEHALPTINSYSIECMLYRIPGLAENFIYFNDDFFLIKPTQPKDWFIDGLPVIRGRWETPAEKVWFKQIAAIFGIRNDSRVGFRKTQSKAGKLVGFEDTFFRCYHTPWALRKSTFEFFFEAHPELLTEQIKHRKRHPSQFNPYSLAWHLEIRNKSAHITKHTDIVELHHPEHKSVGRINRLLHTAEKNDNTIFINIQNLNLALPEQQRTILDWLNRIIPIKAQSKEN